MGEQVETILKKLDEMHTWFTANLQTDRAELVSQTGSSINPIATGITPRSVNGLTFALYEEQNAGSGPDPDLICTQVAFVEETISLEDHMLSRAPLNLFRCLCSSGAVCHPSRMAAGQSSDFVYTCIVLHPPTQ